MDYSLIKIAACPQAPRFSHWRGEGMSSSDSTVSVFYPQSWLSQHFEPCSTQNVNIRYNFAPSIEQTNAFNRQKM